jgi:putative nucleotidyltransferase with HDIG domain
VTTLLEIDPHSREVAQLAGAIAEQLSLTTQVVRVCRLGGLLHDVGKRDIPREIIDKPGPLDEEEWRLMRLHPALGEQLLRANAPLDEAARAVRHHHERWDGRGYPDALRGEAVPVEARVIAVADAFAAMTTTRPYRDAIPYADALAELRRGAGSQFDPRAVRAVERCSRRPPLPRHATLAS